MKKLLAWMVPIGALIATIDLLVGHPYQATVVAIVTFINFIFAMTLRA